MITLEQLQDSGTLLSLSDIRERVSTIESRNIPDKIVSMTDTHVTPELDFHVPGMGILSMTPWAKSQLSSCLGVRWDTWNEGIDHNDVQDELQRRFKRQDLSFLVRGREWEEPVAQSRGELRAFLSPAYHTIDDDRILDCLANSEFGKHVSEKVNFIDWRTNIRTMFTDRSTHITGVMHDPVMIHNPHTGKEDEHYHGFVFRNSEVGYRSLTLDDFWFRVVCLNGMVAMVGNRSLLKQRHIPIEDDALSNQFSTMWTLLQDRREMVEDTLLDAAEEKIANPVFRMREFLRRKGVTKALIETAVHLYDEEPNPTRYGLAQAITATARTLNDPDSRMELERVGGQFLLAGS